MHGGVQALRNDAPCCLSASVGPPLGGALGGPLEGPLRGGDRGGLPSAYIVMNLIMAGNDVSQDIGDLVTMGMAVRWRREGEQDSKALRAGRRRQWIVCVGDCVVICHQIDHVI